MWTNVVLCLSLGGVLVKLDISSCTVTRWMDGCNLIVFEYCVVIGGVAILAVAMCIGGHGCMYIYGGKDGAVVPL